MPAAFDRKAVLLRLLREGRPYYPRLVLSMLLGIVAGAGVLIFPPAFQLVVTGVISDQHHDLRLLWEVVAGVFVVTAVANAASYGQSYLTAWSGQRLIASLRVRLFARVMRLPLGEFDKWRAGEFFSRFTNDLNLMTDAASIALPQMFQTVITFFGALVLLFYTDWLLTLFLFVCAPVVSRVVATFTRLISERDASARNSASPTCPPTSRRRSRPSASSRRSTARTTKSRSSRTPTRAISAPT